MTTIVKPTWTVDGWTGNAVDANGVVWFVHEDRGWFSPLGVRSSDIDRPAADGSYSSQNYRRPRVITLTGLAKAPTPDLADAACDVFNSLLSDGHLFPLVVGENTRELTALVKLGPDPDLIRVNRREFRFQLTLVAPDPRKYSTTRTASTGLASPAAGGVLWDGVAGVTGTEWDGPAGVTGTVWEGAIGNPGTVLVTNAGKAPTPVVLTISGGSVTDPLVRNMSTGEVISYGGTLTAADVLVIDTATGRVTLNGANRRPQLTRADFFTIAPGSTLLSFEGTPVSGTPQLLVAWADAYH